MDDDITSPAPGARAGQPNLDPMGVAELQDYIATLRLEITRAEQTIKARRAQHDLASSVFRSTN